MSSRLFPTIKLRNAFNRGGIPVDKSMNGRYNTYMIKRMTKLEKLDTMDWEDHTNNVVWHVTNIDTGRKLGTFQAKNDSIVAHRVAEELFGNKNLDVYKIRKTK